MKKKSRQNQSHTVLHQADGVDGFDIISHAQMRASSRSAPLVHQPDRHVSYTILYYSSGRGKQRIDFCAYPCRPPMIYLISPGQVHYPDQMRDMLGHGLRFTGQFLLDATADQWIDQLGVFHCTPDSPAIRLSHEQQIVVERTIETLLAEHAADRMGRRVMLQAWLRILLVHIQRMSAPERSPSTTAAGWSLVCRLKQSIARDRYCHRSVRHYADQLGIATDPFARAIKAATGQPPGSLIRREIALEAKRLLVHTEWSAATIGHRLGFSDPSNFARFFKREAGCRPRTFRWRHQENYPLFAE